MRKILALSCACVALIAAPAAAQVTLFDQANMPQQFVTPESLTFTATSGSTILNFQGYQLPGTLALVNLFFNTTGTTALLGGSNNLLDTNYTYTPAACGAFAHEGSLGIYGADDLTFGGGCAGSYDTFSQVLNTSVGSSYTLSFSFSNVGQGLNGLRITAGDAVTGAVPEPGTWAMMLLGFGGIGFVLRRKRSNSLAQLA